MTMVRTLRFLEVAIAVCRPNLACRMLVAVFVCLGVLANAGAQQPRLHYRHSGDMPPGAIGRAQLQRGGPLPGYFQPVELQVPDGTKTALATGGSFEQPQAGQRKAALLVGQVYRLRVTNIPLQPGVEVFPTIEVINRLYPPPGREPEFPIPIELTASELSMAAAGKFVMRVIYLEHPGRALPARQVGDNPAWFEAKEGDDPLLVADLLGRPVAILRMGARLPGPEGPDAKFLYGSPPWIPIAKDAAAPLPQPEEIEPVSFRAD